MREYESEQKTVKEIIEILLELEQDAKVINGKEKPIKIYAGRENKNNGNPIVMIC